MALAGILEIQLMANMARLSTDMQRAEKTVHDSMDKMGNSVAGVEAAFGKLGHTLALGAVFDQVRRLTDDYTKLTAQLRIATKTQAEYTQGLADVRRIAAESQGDLKATASLYTRLSNSLAQFGATQKQVSSMTEAVALGLKAYGATATEASSAMLQLTQAIGSNRLGGDEFRALMEEMPNMMRILAKSMGVTFGALKTLSAEGKITNAELLKAWSDPALIAALMKQATMTRTITGEMMVFRNNLTMLVGEFMGASKGTEGITASLHLMSDSVLLLAENLKILVLAVTVLSLAYAGKFAVGLVSATNLTLAHSEALAMNAAMNLRAAEATNFGAKAALAQGAASALATGETAAATAANVAYRKSAVELAAAQTAASASAVTGITAVGVAMRTAIMANPLLAVATAIGLIVVAIANWDDIIKTSKASLKWFRDDFLGGMEFLAASVGIGIGELVQKLSLLANLTVPQLKSGEFKKQWDELGKLAEQSRIDAAARIAGVGGKQDAAATIEKNAPFSYSARWLVDSGKYMTTAAKRVQEIAAVTKEYQVNIAQLNKEVSTGLRDSANAALVRATLDKGLKDQIAGINREHALAPNVSVFGEMSIKLEELIAENKTHETQVGKVTEAYAKMDAELGKATTDAQAIAIGNKYGTEAEHLDALAKARRVDEIADIAKINEEGTRALKTLDDQIAAQKLHNDSIGKNAEQIAAVKAEAEALLIIKKETEISDIASTGVVDAVGAARISVLQSEIDKMKELEALKDVAPALEAAKATADAEKEVQKKLWAGIDGFAHTAFDNIFDKGKNTFEEIGKVIKKSILDMLYQMTIKKWIISIGTSLGIPGAANAGGGGASDMLSLASNANSLMSGGNSMSGLASGAYNWAMGGAATGAGIAGMTGAATGMTPLTSSVMGLAAPAPVSGLAEAVSGLSAAIPWIGAGLAAFSLLGSFSSSSSSITGSGLNIGGKVGAARVGGYQTGTTTDSSWWGMSEDTSTWRQSSAVGKATTDAIGGMFDQIRGSMLLSAAAIGQDVTALDKQIADYTISIGDLSLAGMDAAARTKAIQDAITGVGDSMVADLLPAVVKYQAANEGLLQTLVRVATEVTTLTVFYKELGVTTAVTLDSATLMIGALGGAQQASTLMQSFVTGFAPAAQQTAIALSKIEAAGLSGFKTATDWWNYMQTASAAEQVAILKNQDAIKSYIDSMAALTKALRDTAQADYAAAVNAASAMGAFAQSVIDLQRSLWLGAQSPLGADTQVVAQQANFLGVNARAASGDATAQGQLSSAATSYLDAAKAQAVSAEEYARSFAFVQNALADTALTATTAVTVAELQLEELRKANAWLQAVDTKNATQIANLADLVKVSIASTQAASDTTNPVVMNTKTTADVLLEINKGASSGATSTSAGFQTLTSTGGGGILGGIFGAVGGIISSIGDFFGGLFSDPRLKENISPTGISKNGFMQYDFSYISDPTHQMYRGVMADEVKRSRPDAVRKGPGGYDMVNYAKLGLQMQKIPSFAVGINAGILAGDTLMQAHGGEEIKPAAYVDRDRSARNETNALLSRLVASNDESKAELKAARRELADIRRTNQNMDWTTNKWDNEGIPEVRTA